MTIAIKLDAAAVRELFPEGSEARLELYQAVIAETVKRLPAKSELQAFTTQLVLQHYTSATLEQHLLRPHWKDALSDKTKKMVQAEAALQFHLFSEEFIRKEMTAKVAEMKDDLLDQLKLTIESHVTKLSPSMELEARKYLLNHITKVVESAGKELLKD